MSSIEILSTLLVLIAFTAFAGKRSMTYLHYFQQDEYDSPRFMKWMFRNGVFDRKASAAIFVLGFFQFFVPTIGMAFLNFIAFALFAYFEKDPRKGSKKKLVLTTRAKRILFPALSFAFLLGIPVALFLHPWVWILLIQAIPFLLILSTIMMQPVEESVQKGFWNEAHAKLTELQPTVIGITGSFGKTSAKHMLGHVLKTQAPTLITPGSVNTPMGITRIIREQLDDSYKYFVVEMGAYGPGSIKRLCDLAPPNMAIITAIGHAHYERFKTLEAVAETKYELAQAVIQKEGPVIAHERTLRFDYTRQMKEEHAKSFTICGEDHTLRLQGEASYLAEGDLQIKDIAQLDKGLQVLIHWEGTDQLLELPLFGVHHGHNAALVYAAARRLGFESDVIKAAFKTMPQIPHRLEVKRQATGLTIIDDAYNSNPVGFRCALELLPIMTAENGGKKILITPGMVEMGAAHNEAHLNVGKIAGGICDVAITIQPERIKSFAEGFKQTGHDKQLIEATSFREAWSWVEANANDNDVVLIENDLPDLYERLPKL